MAQRLDVMTGDFGKLTISAGSGEGNNLPDGRLFRWALATRRDMHERTQINTDAKSFLPGHTSGILRFAVWIDQDLDPGEFNDVLATVVVWPSAATADANKKRTFTGWLNVIDWSVRVDQPNILLAEIVVDGGVTHSWS